MKQNYFTIGEVSKIIHLPVRTLHYYDEIGLFKPAYVDPATNYRYYSELQLANMDLIKSLKYIGTSLNDIKHAQNFTPAQLFSFLNEQQERVNEKLRKMQEVQLVLQKTMKQLEEQIKIPVYEEIYEKDDEGERLLAVKTPGFSFPDDPSIYFNSVIETVEQSGSAVNMRYGGIYALQDYQTIEDLRYDYLFMPLLTSHTFDYIKNNMDLITSPAGHYACIAFEYTFDQYLPNYQKLYQAIAANGWQVQSPIYELFLPTSFSPNDAPTYTVELKVKIKA